ncbi:sugar phosphate isomerase/epimerase [Paenibacillus tarimensis]|uniref:sugar phosphate isomerase/epimerase n=1 Tax=Paenibacillus tarimensis TaxID=416012 RepID=UPI001F2AA019|nr:sugar phosphate isomerase/epimerase [Paenibacillus tarimensis]MCF2945384.1 sugar phosphate isomerase/epimerase [Paenibacillus tarimensis]
MISEVGAWSNPISPDEGARRKALDFCKQQLALAEEIGARCCVNIAGAAFIRSTASELNIKL